MNERQLKLFAKELFKEEFGIILKDIPPRNEPTPDFETSIGDDKYTLELKGKEDDPKNTQWQEELLEKGKVVTLTTPLNPRNTLSGIIEEAVNQLNGYDPLRNTFQIVWLHCGGKNSSIHWERFRSTLYGAETLVSRGRKSLIMCYYFHNSSFYRWKDKLDAAFLTTPEESQLCINSLSPRADLFRSSGLVKTLGQGLCDPAREGKSGAMVADCDVDRKTLGGVLGYLKTKYKIDHLQVMSLTNINVSAKLDLNK